jgi:amidase
VLRIKDLHTGYGNMRILMGVTLSVGEGEIVGVLGRNGVGKTTLMKSIMGLLKCEEGCIEFHGSDISKDSTHARCRSGIGYVPQGRHIFPRLSVRDNLRVAAKDWSSHDIAQAIEKFPKLRARFDTLGRNLSGGEQQILSFVRALLTMPKLLLVDEPTEGIQPLIVDVIFDEIKRMNKESRLTVLIAEQNIDFVMGLAGRILLMHQGRVVQEMSSQELLENKEIQAEYLGV